MAVAAAVAVAVAAVAAEAVAAGGRPAEGAEEEVQAAGEVSGLVVPLVAGPQGVEPLPAMARDVAEEEEAAEVVVGVGPPTGGSECNARVAGVPN